MLEVLFKSYLFKRGLALYIDMLIASFVVLIFFYFFDRSLIYENNNNEFVWRGESIWGYQLLIYLGYSFSLEYYFGYTVGKKILGFKVYFDSKERLLKRFLLRTIIRIIPINFFSFLILPKKRFWHETFSNIFTIRTR